MSADNLDAAARAWVIREDAGTVSPTEASQLQTWLDADPRHLGAYVRAKAAWSLLDRAQVLEAPAQRQRQLGWRPFAAAGAMAAVLAVAAAVVGFVALRPTVYTTPLGETRRVHLQDGSLAILDADTRLDVRIALGERRLRLVRGQAWFQVAHDTHHPFIVRAGPAQVRAVGTAFSVSNGQGHADLIVTDGVVEARSSASRQPLRVAAGEKAAIDDTHLRLAAAPRDVIDSELAWRDGRIGLNGDALALAVDRFNRFNRRHLVLDSPELGAVSVVGWFRLDDPESFARAVAIGLHAHIDVTGDKIVIARNDRKN